MVVELKCCIVWWFWWIDIQLVQEMQIVLGMWRWHKSYHWLIILRFSVSKYLIKSCLPEPPLLFQLSKTFPLPIQNQHTILICIKVCNYLLLFSLYFCKELNLIFWYFLFYGGGGIPTLYRLMIIMKWYSWSIYTKDFYNLTT